MKNNIAKIIFKKLTGELDLMKIIGKTDSGAIYDVLAKLFEELEISISINKSDLQKIPKDTPFIAVGNHPFGILDEFILLSIFTQYSENFKILSDYSQKYLNNHENLIFHTSEYIYSEQNLLSASSHLLSGGGLGLFPAGETSSFQPSTLSISDCLWKKEATKFIYESGMQVLPIFINGNNSLIYYLSSIINPNLKSSPLPGELLNKRKMDIQVRIGNPISVSEIQEFENHGKFGRYLRSRIYSLGSAIEVKKFFFQPIAIKKAPEEIAPKIPDDVIVDEIGKLSEQICYTQQNFDIYIASSSQIPNILNEIGRLREITFRAIGEGTNKSFDLDEYDLYYHHLFLWDRDEKKIAGAYRLGKGKEIISKYGIRGFYTKSLFRFDKKFSTVLEQTIELGRSFVIPEYQNKRLPLFMLWKGIMYFILTNPDHRYLLGPVSISNFYSHASKSLIVEFIERNHFNYELAKLIKPKKKFKAKIKNVAGESLLENVSDNIFKMDKIISEIEPANYTIPVLLKRYIKQNAKIIGFNIDPKFNDALDGLMILDLKELPLDTIETMRKDLSIV